MARYLQRKDLFSKYRVVSCYDQVTNDYPRDENNNIDASFDDIYIKCRYGNQIYYYGKGKKRGQHYLVAYIPSIGRGNNILKALDEEDETIPFDIEKTDGEILFKFDAKHLDTVATLLKAYLNRKSKDGTYHYISPFSAKNLPKVKYSIPEDDLQKYKDAISPMKVGQANILLAINKLFTKKYILNRKFENEDMRSEQRKMGLSGKNYIHAKGLWNEYVQFIQKYFKENKE